ncbi:MAG: mechanosensitive ion channel domain-containing protein [Burkholderiales bacterium]
MAVTFMRGWRGWSVHVFALVALAWLLCPPVGHAQLPDPLKGQAAGKGLEKPAPFEPQKLKAHVEKELRQLRERLLSDQAQDQPVPADIAPEERDEARKARTMLAHMFAAQLEGLDQIEQRQKAREAAEKAERAWPGFKETPPYSILLSDNAREQVDTHRAGVELLKLSRPVLEVEAQRFGARAEQAKEALRRAAEVLEGTTPGTAAHAAANWRLEFARDRSRLATEIVATVNIGSRELDARLAISQAELRFAERQLTALAGKVRISKSDLNEARTLLDAARAQREKELQSLLAAGNRWAREREQASKALEAMRASPAAAAKLPGQEQELRLAEARFRAAEAWSHSLRQQVRILTVLVTLYHDRILEAWDWRYTVLAGEDADARQRARKQLDEVIEYLRGWSNRGKTQQNEVRSALREQDQRVQSVSDPAVLKFERDALDAFHQLDLALERQQALIARRLARLEYWRQEFAEALTAGSMGDIARELLVRSKSLAQDIWNYELLTIEDKVEVGGQTVTSSRGITVGKSIGAILLFLIGLRLMIFLSARMERLLVRRFSVGEQQAKTLRRWANVLGVLALLMITLNLARIPLTVFAFAGGALAIGIGFGMQTLIKNLISGMIVLVERHVRVGDIIEVEGVTGRVTAVDIRSSTVRGFDGVESMIPNSSLLEQKVTNWTLTNAHLRRVLKVGVAYGSPVRTVERILEECAGRHAVVLKDPAPRVIFEDFGDSALVFALYFWIDLTPSTNALQVLSDLRFMIDKELREAEIVVAFPQRDIHLDTTHPIKIEVVSPGDTSAAGSARAGPRIGEDAAGAGA